MQQLIVQCTIHIAIAQSVSADAIWTLKSLAHPTGFEPVTSAFGARCILVKGLKNIAPNSVNQQERIKNITPLSGNNPEALGA
jgi:hypothetical protein